MRLSSHIAELRSMNVDERLCNNAWRGEVEAVGVDNSFRVTMTVEDSTMKFVARKSAIVKWKGLGEVLGTGRGDLMVFGIWA